MIFEHCVFLCSFFFFFYTLQTKDSFLVNKRSRRAKARNKIFWQKTLHCRNGLLLLLLERREQRPLSLSLSALVVNFGPESGPGIMLLCMDTTVQLWFLRFLQNSHFWIFWIFWICKVHILNFHESRRFLDLEQQ